MNSLKGADQQDSASPGPTQWQSGLLEAGIKKEASTAPNLR